METKFNFNSQVCASKSQSERLLALGLKKETADCTLFRRSKNAEWEISTDSYIDWVKEILPLELGYTHEDISPAWSLDRLREIIPENIFTGVRNQWHRVIYNSVLTYEEGNDSLVSFRGGSIYDRFISCIYWLIKEGYFPKEYLEE